MANDEQNTTGSPTAGQASSESPPGVSPPGSSPTVALPSAHWTQAELPPDDHDEEADSSLGDDPATSTASITSSILKYRTVLGRTYHSERVKAQYWGSNDGPANETLDLNHHFLTLCLKGKLNLAPIPNTIQKALDIGTGTGIWAIDFADEHPGCEVIGTDVSPIQPSWVPPNLIFEIKGFNESWTFPSDSVDFVHGVTYLAVSEDGTVTEQSAMGQWGRVFVDGGNVLGQTFTVVPDGLQKKAMEAAGFVEIEEWSFTAPLGSWPKDKTMREIGIYGQATLENDIPGFMSFVANMLGWSKMTIEMYAVHLRREIRNKAIHGCIKLKVVWGKKPEQG